MFAGRSCEATSPSASSKFSGSGVQGSGFRARPEIGCQCRGCRVEGKPAGGWCSALDRYKNPSVRRVCAARYSPEAKTLCKLTLSDSTQQDWSSGHAYRELTLACIFGPVLGLYQVGTAPALHGAWSRGSLSGLSRSGFGLQVVCCVLGLGP